MKLSPLMGAFFGFLGLMGVNFIVFFNIILTFHLLLKILSVQRFRMISLLTTNSLAMIQVGDFGLSRLKANTFLSSKSLAGTVSFRDLVTAAALHFFFLRTVEYLIPIFHITSLA